MRSILFIEDMESQRRLTERLYQMCAKAFHGEVKFLTAADWEAGMKIAHMVDVILLDLVLPPFGWRETLDELSQQSMLPPVVVLTGAEAIPDIREQCFLAGADDFMLKSEANHHPEHLCEKAYHAHLRRKRRDEHAAEV